MAPFLDNAIVIFVLAFIALLIWSKVMNQTMLATLQEIKEFITGFSTTEVPPG